MGRRLSFTDRRRSKLTVKAQVDRLESRNTITEPISVIGLATGALGGLARLGLIQVHGGNAQTPVGRPQAASAAGGLAPAGRVRRAPLPGDVLPFAAVPTPGAGGGGGAPAVPVAVSPARTTNAAGPLAKDAEAATVADAPASAGLSAAWKPANRSGGGSAMAPRGGSGAGGQSAVSAMLRGQSPLPAAPATPKPPATIPGLLGAGPAPAGVPVLPGPVVTRNAAARGLNSGSGSAPVASSGSSGSGLMASDVTSGTSMGTGTIVENSSSLPTSGGGAMAGLSFPYWPLYTLDENDGVVLFNGQYQQENLLGMTDLYAQVQGGSGISYSWTVSGPTSAISGTSSYHLHLQWAGTNGTGANEIATVTLTATDSGSHQETQTYYFVIPPSNATSMPYGASWPTTIPPDLEEPGAPSIASQNVGVDGDSGALNSSIALPSYNPNVSGISLTYNSTTANPMPIILAPHQLDPSQAVPSKVAATLTFNSTPLTTWYYNTSTMTPGDVQQIALQANATSLSTGRYGYSVQLLDERTTNTTFTYSGTATVLNEQTSPFGDGWTLDGLAQITSATGGVILNLGEGGQSLWFSGSPGVGGNYTSPAGDFSTLTLTSTGYTRTLPDGTQITFNPSGYETATIDLNGLHTTYTYNGSNQLTTILDPYGKVTSFTYVSNELSTIQDPAGRLATFTFSGSSLQAVQEADGSRVTYTYDGSGRMTQVKDQRAKATTIVYDSAGRVGTITLPEGASQLISPYQEQGWTNSGTAASPAASTLLAVAATSVTDPNGNTSQLRPDWYGLGQLGQSTDPLGNVATDVLNANGLPITSVDALNRITQYAYDSLGNPTTIMYPDLTTDNHTYNSDSEPLTHTDANSHTTTYGYDTHGNLTLIHDAMNNLTTLTYTATGRVQSVTDADNHTTTHLYDNQDRITTIQFPDGTTNLLAYSSAGQVIQLTDGRGNATTYAYDALNRETGTTDALGNHSTYGYDPAGNRTQQQLPTPAGQTARTTNYAYDSMDRVTTVTDPLGKATVTAYDSDGNKLTVKDPMGRVTSYQYDADDRVTTMTDPMGGQTTYTYDADGETLTVTDPMGRTTAYTYSVRGWVATVTDPMGYVATYTYTATGKLANQYQAQGFGLQVQGNQYNADDELSSSTNGMGKITTYTYDGVGDRVIVEDPNTNVTTTVYDSRNRVVEMIEPMGVTVSYTYDNSGNQQTATDALGHTTTTLYDALDRTTTIISAVGGITTITYDVAGRETSLRDPANNITTWAYDSDDRVTTVTEPNGATVTSVYDADGELTDTTDQDGRRTTYAYDKDGAQTGQSWLNGVGSSIYKATYTYDIVHQMTGVMDPFATLTFTYDKDGRAVTMATSGPGTGQPTVTLSYSYDQVGDVLSVTDSLSNQGVTSYAYDGNQKVTSIAQSFGGTAGPQVTFGYDYASRLTSISRQIGTGSTATQVNTTIGYDSANRVVTMADSKAVFQGFGYVTTPLATFVYAYDNASRVTAETDAEGVASFTYDNANELTGVTGSRSESYSYDLNGNRTGTGYHTTVMNEMSTAPGHTYTYDNEGNLISDNNGTTITTYSYDYENRLTTVTTGGTVAAVYTYNALGQRIGFKDSGTQTWTVYDGPRPDANPYADFNGSGSLTVRYLFGPIVVNGAVTSGILARTSSGGTTAWYLTDKLSSLRDIVDTSGNELDHVVYGSFGNIVTETNASNGDRFKFTGMQYDPATGQYFDHVRWFGSSIGRFLSQDPKSFSAGDANLYRYVRNGSINAIDTTGLDESFGSDYWYYLTNPSRMDPGIRIAFYTSVTVAAMAAITAASLYAMGYGMAMAAESAAVAGEAVAAEAAAAEAAMATGVELAAAAEETGAIAECLAGACFADGTPLLTPGGSKPIEEFQVGDWILSAPAHDPEAPPEPRRVEAILESYAVLLELHLAGHLVRTTAAHPFWVRGRGWIQAQQLAVGDQLRGHDGCWVPVQAIIDSRHTARVYNLQIAEYHTYFVGSAAWGFSAWAHNVGMCFTGMTPAGNPVASWISSQWMIHATVQDGTAYINMVGTQVWPRALANQITNWATANGATSMAMHTGAIMNRTLADKLIACAFSGATYLGGGAVTLISEYGPTFWIWWENIPNW